MAQFRVNEQKGIPLVLENNPDRDEYWRGIVGLPL
ncbi:peptidase, U32 family domain protein [Xenorhabdus sp. SF857]|nr:peptidase, U32 family domain protein [Xenorhabdus sp. SF857]WFQ78595.1 peptidase, U32 family domain protein [Xenorhabdus sp. SF857]